MNSETKAGKETVLQNSDDCEILNLIRTYRDSSFKVRSRYLEDEYKEKEKITGKRNIVDPRDIQGCRLSEFWGPGDTILTVTMKKVQKFVTTFFDPDTYTKENYKILKKNIQLFESYIYIYLAVFTIPLVVYYPFILPRIKKVKQDYFIHNFTKKRFFEQELGLRNTKMRLAKMKEILRKSNEK